MKPTVQTHLSNVLKCSSAVIIAAGAAFDASASADYGPAIWRPVCSGKWNTSGYGKKFFVEHTMEGYYLTGIAYIQRCDVSVSIHYAVSGKKDTTSDANPGEVSQLVSDVYYAYHARCWNNHCIGTEHEGFVSNPAWYTTQLYDSSAALTKSKAEKYGFPKDRNRIIGHNEKSRSAWVSYANANLGINATCNTHSDPGPYWDWSGYMARINPPPPTSVIVDNSSAGFSVTGTSWASGSSSTDKYGSDYRYHSTAPVSEPAQWLATVSGTKNVAAWWPQGSNRSATASYHVFHSGGTSVVAVNQQANGGKWNSLGSWGMTTGKVQLSCWTATGYIVVADAIRWQ